MRDNGKKLQISEKLFFNCLKIICFEDYNTQLLDETAEMLEQKLDSMIAHQLYSKYKTADTEEEKEKARKEYLDKVGIHKDWR